MTDSQDSCSKVWAKGDTCMSPYSGDKKLYKAVIQRINRSPTGHLTATVKYQVYGDEEEVDVARLQEVKITERDSSGELKMAKKSRPTDTSGMFKPLIGGEACERLKEKYCSLDEETEIKSEKLSEKLFASKKSPLPHKKSPSAPNRKLPLTSSQKSSQGQERQNASTSKYTDYSDDEETSVARLQRDEAKDRGCTVQKSKPSEVSGMFKPLTGGEDSDRLKEKYGSLDKETELKTEKLSETLFASRKSPSTSSQKSSQGKERKKVVLCRKDYVTCCLNSQEETDTVHAAQSSCSLLDEAEPRFVWAKIKGSPVMWPLELKQRRGIVAVGGEAVSSSRSPVVGKKVKDKSPKIDYIPSSDKNSVGRKKNKDIVARGGAALDRNKELPTTRKLSDISSILDSDSVHEALNGNYKTLAGKKQSTTADNRKSVIENNDDIVATEGFDEDDLEKPKFYFKPEGAKVPYILSEKGQEPAIQVPATINQYLRDYQREGIKFLYTHYTYDRGAILGDDMGLGKTVQVIGFLAALLGKQGNRVDVMRQKPQFIRKLSDTSAVREDVRVTSPFLIIGPGCVLYNWLEELETWGYFTVRKFHGASKNDCLTDIKKRKVEIVVTTFETFREHQKVLNKIEWEAVIADEVHKIKGLRAQTTQALRSINTRRRYGLTGTALQNNLLELWSILDWAQPGCLGGLADFKEEYVNPIELGQRHDANKRELAQARKKKERFAEIRKGMMIRRMKTLIAEQLPKKDDNVVFCRLSQLQTDIYKTILDHPDMDLVLHMEDPCGCDSGIPQSKCCRKKTPDGHSVKSLMFTFMHLLLKASNHVALLVPKNNISEQQNKMAKKICEVAFEKHPGFVNQTREASFQTLSDPKYCGKMKVLQGLLKVFYKDHSQILVFSYSTQVLDIIEQYLMSTGYEFRRIDGSVSAKKRLMIVREFNTDPSIFVCLISTKAGGLGLNLTGANRVIIFDPNWNPTHDLQAQDRAYRIGQRRNVQVYRLVSAGTIEENMYLRQIYKQQLLNVSVEDENARRYFYAVQGSRHQKGELFGVKNMFQLHTGKSCLTVDILKRNERVESALAGFEMTKYMPPVVRLEEDDDYEDVEYLQGKLARRVSSESEEDLFAQFFSSQGERSLPTGLLVSSPEPKAHKETKTATRAQMCSKISEIECFTWELAALEQDSHKEAKDDDDEVDGDRVVDSDNSSNNDGDILDSLLDSSENLLSNRKKKTKFHQTLKQNVRKNNHVNDSEDSDSDMSDSFDARKHSNNTVPKPVASDARRNYNVRFKTPENDNIRRGKVRPSQSTTGKGPVQQRKQAHVGNKQLKETFDSDDGSARVDQTLAGSFNDVGDVFENCGVVHIHENIKVVGGSRAEDHMSKCAVTDVYELHQNSQDLAVQCDPLSESSEEEHIPTADKRKAAAEDHNTSRSVVVDNMKVLIGQTPRGLRLKELEKMSKEKHSGSLTEFAELVLSSTKAERIEMLNKYYERWNPKLKDILTGSQMLEKQEEMSRGQGRQRQQKQQNTSKRRGKARPRTVDQTLAGVVYEDMADSESLPGHVETVAEESSSDENMDIGVSPVKRRKIHILNQTRSKSRKITPRKESDHVQIPPTYLDYPLSDEDTPDNEVSNQAKRKMPKEVPGLTTEISANQLDCVDNSAGLESVDSCDLWHELAKMSQANVKVNTDEENRKLDVSVRNLNVEVQISENSAVRGKRIKKEQVEESNKNVVQGYNYTENSKRISDGSESTSRNTGSKSHGNQNSRTNKVERTEISEANEDTDSQISVLDDIFGNPEVEIKTRRRPAPSKGRTTKDLNKLHKARGAQASVTDSAEFGAVVEQQCSTDSVIHLETSTLKDDDLDCFDDPGKRKKRKRKPERDEMSAIDKLISDSEADFSNLFATGKMKRNDKTSVNPMESSSARSCDGSASLFS